MSKTYRVVAWSTGNVGRNVIAGIDARPDLELVGLWVSNPDKVGRDAGELAGLDRTLGVAATDDVDAIFALRPDVIVHTAMADDRLFEALADLQRILRAGINVVSSGPVFLQYPYGVVDEGMFTPTVEAAERGRRLHLRQRGRPRLRQRCPAPGAVGGERADRRGAGGRGAQLRHLQPGHGPLRHHGLRPSDRRRADDPPARRHHHGLGQRRPPTGRRTRGGARRRPGRVVRAGARP